MADHDYLPHQDLAGSGAVDLASGLRREIQMISPRAARRATSAVVAHGPASVVVAGLAKHRGAKQKLREFAALARMVRREQPRTVIEIGTYRGGTMWAWCRLAHEEAMLVSIDLPGGDYGGGYADVELQRLRGYARRGQRMHLLRADSHLPATQAHVEELLGGRKVDLLFIDGDHTYEGVRSDFEAYGRFVRPGGLIALHDVLPHASHARCEVDVLWAEIRDHYTCKDLSDPSDVRWDGTWGGIGVIRQPEGGPAELPR